HPHGTSLRYLRQRAAVWKQNQSRSQREPAPLEREPPAGARAGERRQQARSRLHRVPQGRQGRQGILEPSSLPDVIKVEIRLKVERHTEGQGPHHIKVGASGWSRACPERLS